MPMQAKFELNEVFGVSNQIIETYIHRKHIDDLFLKALILNKHIIIYGASKQGKTSLLKIHLVNAEYLVVQCSPNSTTIDIYKSVIRQICIVFKDDTFNIQQNSVSRFKVEIKSHLFQKEVNNQKINDISYKIKSFEYDITIPQDFCELLKLFDCKKKIVIENFHYLTEHVQRKLAFDLRTFQDWGFVFVILGIWREKNHLLQFNGDLLDRLIEIPVEPWSRFDFYKIIRKGEELLNIDLSIISDSLVSDSNLSVGVLQELCYEICLIANIKRTQTQKIKISDSNYLKALELKLEHYSSRHIRSLESFIEQKLTYDNETPKLFLPFYFIKVLSKIDFIDIEKGLNRKKIESEIIAIHHCPENIRPSDFSNFLHNIVQSQIAKNINPPLFDYDLSNKTLKIIDSTLYFYLKYFQREKLIEELTSPIENIK